MSDCYEDLGPKCTCGRIHEVRRLSAEVLRLRDAGLTLAAKCAVAEVALENARKENQALKEQLASKGEAP